MVGQLWPIDRMGLGNELVTNWIRQDDIDNGRRAGVASSESAELRAARRRIRELETELLIVRQAAKFLDKERPGVPTATAVCTPS